MKLRQRIGFLFKNNMEEYIKQFMTGGDLENNNFDDSIDSTTAMKYSAVFACNKVLAETFASVPVMLYRKGSDDGRETVNDIGIYDILHFQPNEEMSPFNFKEMLMTSINLGGNAICERLIGSKGQLVGLYPYDYSRVDISRDKDSRKLIYTIDSDGMNKKILTRSQVFHVPNLSLDGIIGLSPITYASSAIRLGISYEQFGVKFYKNGANPSGSFENPGELGEESFNRLKKELKENYTGLKNTGTPMLLEGGMKFNPHTINPIDAQLLESKSFQIEDICRIYRVPQHLVQLLGHATFSNIEQQSLEFVMYTMLPIFKRFEENINMQLLTTEERGAGYYIEFKMDGLLRGDAASRAAFYASGRQWGYLSVNDIRKLENLPSIANGDIYLQPLNMVDAAIANEIQLKNIINTAVKAETEKIYNMISNKN